MPESLLHSGHLQRARQFQTETLKQNRLVLGRASDAALANRHATSCRQENIDQRHLRQFLKHLSRFVAQPGALTELRPKSSTTHRLGSKLGGVLRRASVSCARSAEVVDPISECARRPPPRSAECTPARVLLDSSPAHCCAAGSNPHSTVPTVASDRFSSS